MGFYQEFADRLNDLLNENDRSAAWLARQVGVSPASVSRWLSGESRPGSVELVIEVAAAFNLAQNGQNELIQYTKYQVDDSSTGSDEPDVGIQNKSGAETRNTSKLLHSITEPENTHVIEERKTVKDLSETAIQNGNSAAALKELDSTNKTKYIERVLKSKMLLLVAMVLVFIAIIAVFSERFDFSRTQSMNPTTSNTPENEPDDSKNEVLIPVRTNPPITDSRIIGYYGATSVGDYSQYLVTDIPVDKLTHIIYASFSVSQAGECILGQPWADIRHPYPGDKFTEPVNGNLNRLLILKQQSHNLKTILSVGGWDGSTHLSRTSSTAESRKKFAESCIQVMKQYGFDGLEIDWKDRAVEGKRTWSEADKPNYTLLLAELRRQLDISSEQDGHLYLLTITTGPSLGRMNSLELPQISQYLDWVALATFDLNASWIGFTGFQSALYPASSSPFTDKDFHDVDSVVQAYLSASVPSEKLVLGVPFFGRGWNGVSSTNEGLFQVWDGEEEGTWGDGRINYHDIKTQLLPTYDRSWDDQANAPWLFNPDKGIMVSYEDSESLTHKARYVKQMNSSMGTE